MAESEGNLEATILAIASFFNESVLTGNGTMLKPEVMDSAVGYLLTSLEKFNASNASTLLSPDQATTSVHLLHTLVKASNASSLLKETFIKTTNILELTLESFEANSTSSAVDTSLATAMIETSSITLDTLGCEVIDQATNIMQRTSILAQRPGSGNQTAFTVDTSEIQMTSSSAGQTTTVSLSNSEEIQTGDAGLGIHVIEYKGDLQDCFKTSGGVEEQVVAGSTKNVIMSDNSAGEVCAIHSDHAKQNPRIILYLFFLRS